MNDGFILNHPVIAVLIFAACSAAGALLGVAAAYITDHVHLVSPDNVLAGAAMGIGGALAGMLAAFAILHLVDKKTA